MNFLGFLSIIAGCITVIVVATLIYKGVTKSQWDYDEQMDAKVNAWNQQARERFATMERQINTMLTEWREYKEGK